MNGGRDDLAHVHFISAGAGSGKTYRLTEVLEQALCEGRATPGAVIGTTFTVKAAAELYDRVRTRLIEGAASSPFRADGTGARRHRAQRLRAPPLQVRIRARALARRSASRASRTAGACSTRRSMTF